MALENLNIVTVIKAQLKEIGRRQVSTSYVRL